jgi:hypothetical protein
MVLAALVRNKFNVLVPFGEGQPYDLLVHLGGSIFLRIQCKTAWPVGGCLVFNSRTTDHGRGPQSYAGHADIFGVYFPPQQAVYLVPLDAVAESKGRLRLVPPRNNQRRGIRLAAGYEIDRWTPDLLREIVKVESPRDERILSVA